MTKTDEFIEKIEQLDQHLKVQKYDNVDSYDYEQVSMIVWYVIDDGKLPVVTFTYYNDIPVIEAEHVRFDKAGFALYSKAIKVCSDYFSCFYLREDYL